MKQIILPRNYTSKLLNTKLYNLPLGKTIINSTFKNLKPYEKLGSKKKSTPKIYFYITRKSTTFNSNSRNN